MLGQDSASCGQNFPSDLRIAKANETSMILSSMNRAIHTLLWSELVNHYVEHFGKIPHKIAQYLTDRVPMTPRFLKVTGVDEATREAITQHVAPAT